MIRCSALCALCCVLSFAAAAGAQPAAPATPPSPSAPPPPAPASPPAPAAAPPAAPAAPAPRAAAALGDPDEARQGVVRLERAGRPIGMGVALRSDGRILTALSALGHGNFVQARFADGSVLGVRVVASERAWDLALLATEDGHWTLGSRPSVLEPPQAGSVLHRFRVRGARLEPTTVSVSARQALLGRDGATLADALVLSTRLSEDELGTPLLDEHGEVAAIAVQACAPAPAQGCQLAAAGAPVSALKQFLKKAPPREPLPAASLGFRGVPAHDGSIAGVRVIAVEPGSPAAQAGLRADPGGGREPGGDLIVAVEDAPVVTPDELRDAVNRIAFRNPPPASAAGATHERRVRLLVFGSGKFREVLLPIQPPRALPKTEPAPPGTQPTAPPAAVQPPAPTPSQSGSPPRAASPSTTLRSAPAGAPINT